MYAEVMHKVEFTWDISINVFGWASFSLEIEPIKDVKRGKVNISNNYVKK